MRRAGVGARMLCLCTTLGQDGLTARLLVVQSGRQERLLRGTRNPTEGGARAGVLATHGSRPAVAVGGGGFCAQAVAGTVPTLDELAAGLAI
jgi:hypothetical protein